MVYGKVMSEVANTDVAVVPDERNNRRRSRCNRFCNWKLISVIIVFKLIAIAAMKSTRNENLTIKVPHFDLKNSPFNIEIKKSDLSFESINYFHQREEEVQNFCRNYTDDNDDFVLVISNIIIDTQHAISWCPIYKAASSTWMRNFALLAGVSRDLLNEIDSENGQINNIVRQRFPQNTNFNITLETLHDTKKFLIVRHPLERLLSAYRDKLEKIEGREYYYKRYGRHITNKYRQYRDPNDHRLEPTFEEFLRYIVDEKYFDEHWAPYYKTCMPCTIHYDYILKFETLLLDEINFIISTGLWKYLALSESWYNENLNRTTNRELVEEYANKLPTSLLDDIDKIYEIDLKLFQYPASRTYKIII